LSRFYPLFVCVGAGCAAGNDGILRAKKRISQLSTAADALGLASAVKPRYNGFTENRTD